MAITSKVKISRAGIQRAQPLGFRKSGFRTRFNTVENPDYSNFPPVWYTQSMCLRDIEVDAGALIVRRLGTINGACGHARIEIFGSQYESEGEFTDVTNSLGTQFYDVDFQLRSSSGTIYKTGHLIDIKPKNFYVYLLGGEPIDIYVLNNQANAVRFSIEVNFDIEPLGRIESIIENRLWRK